MLDRHVVLWLGAFQEAGQESPVRGLAWASGLLGITSLSPCSNNLLLKFCHWKGYFLSFAVG